MNGSTAELVKAEHINETEDDGNELRDNEELVKAEDIDETKDEGNEVLDKEEDQRKESEALVKENTDHKNKLKQIEDGKEGKEIRDSTENKQPTDNENQETKNDEESGEIIDSTENKTETHGENQETNQGESTNGIMEEVDITGTARKTDAEQEVTITFNFDLNLTGMNLQPTITEIPDDLKQPMLAMEFGKSIKSVIPGNKISVYESPILIGEQPISSVNELRQLCDEVLQRPLYAIVTSLYKRQKKQNTSRYWTATLEVLVNTSHPLIQKSLKLYLDEAIELIERGTRFCMKISFSKTLQEVIAKIVEPFDHKFGKGCYAPFELCITNCSKRSAICYNPRFICCCFLCWIFAGPCYMTYRCIAVKDIHKEFQSLPLVFVNQKGEYEIISLRPT